MNYDFNHNNPYDHDNCLKVCRTMMQLGWVIRNQSQDICRTNGYHSYLSNTNYSRLVIQIAKVRNSHNFCLLLSIRPFLIPVVFFVPLQILQVILTLKNMSTFGLAILALIVFTISCKTINVASNYGQTIDKGLTFQITVEPTKETSWTARFSCNNCNPFEGDQPCTNSLPLICIVFPQVISRPDYPIKVRNAPYQFFDGSYYEGWTGGVAKTTYPIAGTSISNYNAGDVLCKRSFGNNARFATFDSGYYMPKMDEQPVKTWALWDWNQAKPGGWNFWSYINTKYRERGWVWVKGQPNGNCGV